MAMTFDYFSPADAEQYAFYRIPKMLISDARFHCISAEAKLLYGILLDRVSLSLKNGWVDEDNHVYIIYTIEQAMEDLNCSNKKAISLLKELEKKIPLIRKKRQGLGKPNLIYVKNFYSQSMDPDENPGGTDPSPSRVKNSHISECNSYTSGNDISTSQDVKNVHGNNTDTNETEFSNTDPILSDHSDGKDGIDKEAEYYAYRKYFREQLGVDALISRQPSEKETILGILDLLTDVCCSAKSVYISGDPKPAAIVRGKFMKLHMGHIEYVLKCLDENTSRITNIRQYLLTMLYNAPSTIGPYYRARVNHDMAAMQNTVFDE